MTFSILSQDPDTGALGGAAATGNLCVGGWVLRGDAIVGMSASQGTAPSTLWGEAVIAAMRAGATAQQAVASVTARDRGHNHRQLSAIDKHGNTASYSGSANIPIVGSRCFEHGIVAGNMLANDAVLDAMQRAYLAPPKPLAERLLNALYAAQTTGGDQRGLFSAALLIVSTDAPPLDLRIDDSPDPIAALDKLYQKTQSGAYAEWLRQLPTLSDPERSFG